MENIRLKQMYVMLIDLIEKKTPDVFQSNHQEILQKFILMNFHISELIALRGGRTIDLSMFHLVEILKKIAINL